MQRAAPLPLRSEELHPGDLIAGKYRVRTILGRSHGLLVEAFHTDFDQRVVIKILLPGATDEHEVERFRREARTLAKLESEHVARIIDVGHQPDGSFYLVRQYLEGTDLQTHLKRAGRLQLQQAVLFVLQAAEAVAETHSHGIILRELQPSHLFLTQRAGGAPLVKVIDFGTAKLMRDAAAPGVGGELTATTMFGMSPYSSPELVRKAKNVDARTDVWSLGGILYELLTGRPPFHGEMAVLMLQITKDEPVPATQVVRGLPAEIDQIIGWCLAKDVDGRFANVHAFAHALTPYATPEGLVLIERIGQITQAAKQRKKSGSVPPPARPVAPVQGGEDSVTNIRGAVKPTDDDGAPLERTMFMGEMAAPPPRATPSPKGPVFGGAAVGMVVPPAGGSQPGQNRPPTIPPNQGGLLGPSPQYDAPKAAAPWQPQEPQRHDLHGAQSPMMGGHTPMSSSVPEGAPFARTSTQRKVTIGALTAAAVFLPVLAVVLILRGQSAETAAASSEVTAPVSLPVPTETAPPPAPVETAAPVATPAPVETAPPPAATAEAVADTKSGTQKSGSSGGSSGSSKPSGGSSGSSGAATTTASKPSTPPPASTGASSTPAAAGGTGTLVAVAVGGSCAFSVNGASKGTMSTLKVSLKPGSYSVSCKPATGATKSRSVTIKSGETAMAMFKLQ